MTNELSKLKSEVNQLKKQKEIKLQLATSIQERDQLIREIAQLEAVKKSPTALKNFGKTFGRGLGIVGKTLWKGISSASRNLDRNAPEFKEFGKTMTSTPSSQSPPDIDNMYTQRPMPSSRPPVQRRRTMPKKKKGKQRKARSRKMVYNSQPKQNPWDMP